MTIPKKKTATDALGVISAVALTSFVIALLYFGREMLIPLVLAALLTFLLAPLITRLERWIGRIVAVLMVVTMIFAAAGAVGWVLTRQLMDLGTKLPDYKDNIVAKLHAFRMPQNSAFSAFSKTIEELKKEVPGGSVTEIAPATPAATRPEATVSAPPVVVMPPRSAEFSELKPMELVQSMIASVLGPLGTSALVLLLVVYMLLQREDLRSRMIRLVGQGHISATTRAMDDAGQRVSRYLLMLLVVNVTYGTAVAIGLALIGVPNAILWGGFSTVLRFIPYVGPWIAASIPITLSLAVSPGWIMPLLTIGVFVVLELLSNNLMEPWLYGSSTGVSAIALIVGAVFWTWLWGPVGLVLATPLTVCLVVMGRHVPRLSFFSVLLSDEEALTPAEDCYHRLLTPSVHDEIEFVEDYLKTNPLVALYDAVFIPVIGTAELDVRQDALDQDELLVVEQSMKDIIQDLATRPNIVSTVNLDKDSSDEATSPVAMLPCRVCCLPAHAERDELAGLMLVHLLQQQGLEAWSVPGNFLIAGLPDHLKNGETDVVCISVLPPSTIIHARSLCLKVHTQFPHCKIVVGLWSATEVTTGVVKRLCDSGADAVVATLAQAVAQIAKFNSDRLLNLDQLEESSPAKPLRDGTRNESSRAG